MFALGSYAPAHPRLVGLTWGAEDLAAALGATDNKEADGAWTFPYTVARAQCLFAASAAEVAPIDTLYADFRDAEGLERDCRRSRRDGFIGRIAIHPDQVATINRCYAPSEAEIAHARQHRRGLRGQSRRRHARHRRQDGRHSASEGGAEDAGVDLKT